MKRTEIYLVPGFFGFKSLGALEYFYRVPELLSRQLESRGVDARIHECEVLPAGSISRRAESVYETVQKTGGLQADDIHFIGHSTGGLDIRLLLSRAIGMDGNWAHVLEKTRTAITISTPHYGSPLANFFLTAQGRHVLRLIAGAATTDNGRRALHIMARLLSFVAHLDDPLKSTDTWLDVASDKLLRQISSDKDDPLFKFIAGLASDQGAMIQLTPEAMNLFNAAVSDPPGVQFWSVITGSPYLFAGNMNLRGWSIEKAVLAIAYAILNTITGTSLVHYPYPEPDRETMERIRAGFPYEVSSRTNDAMVPTLSQVYGKLLMVVESDHLDIVGQYAGASGNYLSDWLPSGSGFDDARFRMVWGRVADAIAGKVD
jgi:triacylglycerol esterase/lipase EstA (alpha/beta hydrolase family)